MTENTPEFLIVNNALLNYIKNCLNEESLRLFDAGKTSKKSVINSAFPYANSLASIKDFPSLMVYDTTGNKSVYKFVADYYLSDYNQYCQNYSLFGWVKIQIMKCLLDYDGEICQVSMIDPNSISYAMTPFTKSQFPNLRVSFDVKVPELK